MTVECSSHLRKKRFRVRSSGDVFEALAVLKEEALSDVVQFGVRECELGFELLQGLSQIFAVLREFRNGCERHFCSCCCLRSKKVFHSCSQGEWPDRTTNPIVSRRREKELDFPLGSGPALPPPASSCPAATVKTSGKGIPWLHKLRESGRAVGLAVERPAQAKSQHLPPHLPLDQGRLDPLWLQNPRPFQQQQEAALRDCLRLNLRKMRRKRKKGKCSWTRMRGRTTRVIRQR